MSHNDHNSNSSSNWYASLADEAEVEEISLHTISDNSISITTAQAIVDKVE